MTDAERALLKKLAFTISALCAVVAARDPFGTLGRLSQEIDALSTAVDKDMQKPSEPKRPRGWDKVES